jgi:hypothetical protein
MMGDATLSVGNLAQKMQKRYAAGRILFFRLRLSSVEPVPALSAISTAESGLIRMIVRKTAFD